MQCRLPKLSRGFTILEILVTIAVIGILASIIIVSYNIVTTRTYEATMQNDLRSVASKLEVYRSDNSRYPTSLDDLSDGVPTAGEASQLLYVYDDEADTFCLSISSTRSGVSIFNMTQSGEVMEGQCEVDAPVYTPPTLTTDYHPCYPGYPAYSTSFAASGDGIITYTLQSGTLPAGFTLDSATGLLSGTAPSSGSYSFVIAATNGGGTATKSISLTFAFVCPS